MSNNTIQISPPVKIQKVEDVSIEENKIKNPGNLWKLVKGKFLLTFYLCDFCKDRLFNDKNKIETLDDHVEVKIKLCFDCVKKNCFATDILAPPKKK
ncbi:hypothetical protein Mgra_00004589 [Meloidogyne graminicola]|uniref:Uncharacterized protein n=1 Tax=Meloidogyne graminicola TaxID=189291 RepID=A0A8S9ZQX1_9BILA|nr:hypothetical protein Mgra_00004589 [Meloidogyne graminicola]